MSNTTERIEVQRTIQADRNGFSLSCGIPKATLLSTAQACSRTQQVSPLLKVGDEFVVHMDREALNDYPMGEYDVTVTITKYEPDREIAWTILGQIRPQIGHVYGYTLEPVDGGTLVTSYYDWSEIDPQWKEANIFPVISETALRATLGILDRTLARSSQW